MDEEARLVALGGLLHDIGKFEQRKSREVKKHQEYGYEFIRKYVERYLERGLENLPLFARYHHISELKDFKGDLRLKNLLWIVYEADNLSSGERLKDEDELRFNPTNPLLSVFSLVNLGKGEAEKLYYPLSEFGPTTYNLPRKGVQNSVKDYESLFEAFEREFEKVAQKGLEFNVLMNLLERYTTYIPAMVVEDSDISLFDHLKTTSAIALAMYNYHIKDLEGDISSKITDREEKKYLVISGDISGIQDFIYTITSKGALKYLRARSLFLELLTEDVVEELIERLKLTRANVIFSGGGRFYILAQNTEEAKEEIEKLSTVLNRWLYDRFKGKLYYAITYIEVNGEELSKFRVDGESIWELVNRELKVKKLRKFLDILREGELVENYIFVDDETFGECEVCKIPEVTEEVEGIKTCRSCKEFQEMGKIIPRIIGFVRFKGGEEHENKFSMPFSNFYALERMEELREYPEGVKVFLKNGYWLNSGVDRSKEVGRLTIMPELLGRYAFIPFYVCDYAKQEEGKIKEFDELAKSASGGKKLAVLRMDVDDLGKVFSIGLLELKQISEEGETKIFEVKGGKDTISRVATLSRFMSHFFKNCLRLLAEGELTAEAPRIKNEMVRKER